MSKLVLRQEAKWYIAKCFTELDDFDRYVKAVKNIEEMANNAIRDSGRIIYINYRKTHDAPNTLDWSKCRWSRETAGVSLFGHTITVFPEAFKTIDD